MSYTPEELDELEEKHRHTPPNHAGFDLEKNRLDKLHQMGLSSKYSHVTSTMAAAIKHGVPERADDSFSDEEVISAAEEERDRLDKYDPDGEKFIGRNFKNRRPGQAIFPAEAEASRSVQDATNVVSSHLTTMDSVNPDPTYDEAIKNVTNFDDKLKMSMGKMNHDNFLRHNDLEPHPMRPSKEADGFYYCSSCKGLTH